ncbi:acetyl-CoA carboxylase family protein [Tomitella gaofuii]|uniref:acetyl-CoA carboxylase family protein n=1 Tax=Tomitella gaofuii TaxID=2760083 RepID=UPI001F3BAA2B|nr:carboxyl transferase domain-containing protein [Tomitella gaofuii]
MSMHEATHAAPATVLVANRGEIAVRVIRTARELGLRTVAVYAADDAASPHASAADEAVALDAAGPTAYLDREALARIGGRLAAAGRTVLVHPGYGFLSEDAAFARACADAGLVFVGPAPDALERCGDKTAARALAEAVGVPVLPATSGDGGLDEAVAFARGRSALMIKARAGGGGRGMREVHAPGPGQPLDPDAVTAAFRACSAEAQAGFGDGAVFAEELLADPRHVEVQIVGDGSAVRAVGDRDCSVQRRHQKLIEIAPAPDLSAQLRAELHECAARLGAAVGYRGAGTVEFLVFGDGYVFLEINPRLQVEHTVTEEVTGIDLVAAQLRIACGATLAETALPHGISALADGTADGEPTAASGTALQARVNMETTAADGTTTPTGGTLTAFSPPSGPGVRVDTFARPGLTPSLRYDPLLAKVIVHARDGGLPVAARKAERALAEFGVTGVGTNIPLLRAILADDEFAGGAPVSTSYLPRRLPELLADAPAADNPLGGDVDTAGEARTPAVPDAEVGPGEIALTAPMTGTVISAVAPGTAVDAGTEVLLLEAMKMHHGVNAPRGGTVIRTLVAPGRTVVAGQPLAVLAADLAAAADVDGAEGAVDLDRERADLALIRERHARTLDGARPEAMAKLEARGRRSARDNIADLVDKGSFTEYGALALAAQRSRRSEEDLIARTPADGMVCGIATVGADRLGRAAAETAVLSYDYTVLAGTQGRQNHAKTDRVIAVASRRRIPLVLFAEGGGGRPGDTDAGGAAGLELTTFRALAALSGRVPLIAVVSGRCFAGNAALAGVCDVLIATPDANIGMGGPAMIEGGGLGTVRPEEIGPVDVQRRGGVIHLSARDEEHAVALARQYLSYFQGPVDDWEAPDPRRARHAVPEDRLRAYDVRTVLDAIADAGSVLELRRDYGHGAVTALLRVEGVPYGVIGNSGTHLGGAIDAEAADKFTEFLTLCQAHGLPVVSLCDTPGFMVGPASEEEATVRRFGRMFIAGARLTVPFGTVILRKGYGLGAMAMAGGSFHAPQFTVAWPTGEIGPMGLEGAVHLGFRKELEAEPDPQARQALFDSLLAEAYARGRALNAATTFEIDDVIDPADTRAWIRTLATG